MKLSDFTLSVLKNFSTINSGMVFNPGNKQRTMSPEKTILVEATLDETFPNRLAVYDLPQFLGNITTLQNPDLEFNDKYIKMNDGTFDLFYIPCSPELVVSPDKELEMGAADVQFDLSNTIITKILRLASMNGLANLTLVGKDGSLSLKAHDSGNDSTNYVSTVLQEYNGADFTSTFVTDNFKIMPDDYKVSIKKGSFGKFESKTRKLTYYIALEVK